MTLEECHDDFDVESEFQRIMMLSPDSYSKKEYWEERYKKDQKNHMQFEWYHPWAFFIPHISTYLKCYGNVLNVGAGNSALSFDLLESGVSHVTSLDISEIVIEHMKNVYKSENRLEWVIGDCRQMDFLDNSFDFIIDKGTMDAILCAYDGGRNAKSMFQEIYRVLKPGSQFMEIATSDKDKITKYLRKIKVNWILQELVTIDDSSNSIYVFILEKQ